MQAPGPSSPRVVAAHSLIHLPGGRVGAAHAAVAVMRWVAPILAAAATLLAAHLGGAMTGVQDALGAMGFDPDRSILITALVVDAAVAAAAVVPRGRSSLGVAAGTAAFATVFGATFIRETLAATSTGPGPGRFDAAGWLTTVGALATVAIVVAATADLLAGSVRVTVLTATGSIVAAIRGRSPRRSIVRPAFVVAALAAVVLAGPIFGDMVNYEPDIRLTSGGPPPVGLVGGGALDAPAPTDTPAGTMDPLLQPAIVPGAGSGAPLDPGRPWLAWRPSGTGRMADIRLPAPWVGGTSPTAVVTVYTPPGYPGSGRRYPVIYEAPWGATSFVRGAHLQDELDGLITSGAIPASIVVFASEVGGPYPDSECVNSADGREWFERYVTDTVVPYVDGHYATIARPAARALLGFSYGGYCAPMLLLRHPDLFSSAISFSGYYQAALRSGETPTAWRPYGGDQALIAATSPIDELATVPAAVRPALFIELSGSPREAFFGPQYRAFAAAVQQAGISLALFPTALGHAWATVRSQLGAVLETLAARENALGIFAG